MIETISLPGTSRPTTRLGFGGSGLMGGIGERESLRLLEEAFDAGIRHFDVAPSYGHGMAERCLGKFLRGKAGEVTVTTKYGILPPARVGLLNLARQAAAPIAKQFPQIRRRLASAGAGLKTRAQFSPEQARHSLDRSLRELGRDRIDLWLLHEATADDLDTSGLLPLLQEFVREGSVGAFGLATDRTHLEQACAKHPAYCGVLQFQWSVLDPAPAFPGSFRIHHRAISGAWGTIRKRFRDDPSFLRRCSGAIDADLSDAGTLAALLLAASMMANPGSIVLFSSRVPAHIRANVERATDCQWLARAERLQQFFASSPGFSG